MSDYIHISVNKSDDAVNYIVSMPAMRIVDQSRWPEFTVEWMGQLVRCKYLHRDAVQVGNAIWFRDGTVVQLGGQR